MHAAALAEDASVFDYDSHFDSIQASRSEPKRQEKMARESRYIASLLEKAEERKREQNVQYERQLAKERAAEDHLYGDKEKFVTAAYKKKLEEEAKWKAEQKSKEEEEERNAVEKRGHMGDFYRNILRNNVAFGTAAAPSVPPEVGSHPREGDCGRQFESNAAAKETSEDDIMPERRAELAREAARRREPAKEREERAVGGTERPREAPTGGSEGPSTKREEEMRSLDSERDAREDSRIATEKPSTSAGVGVGELAPVAAAETEGRRKKEEAIAAARERYLARKRKAEALK